MSRKRKFSDAQLLELADRGFSNQAIALRFGCLERQVRFHKARLGIGAEVGRPMNERGYSIREIHRGQRFHTPVLTGPIDNAEYLMPTKNAFSVPEPTQSKTNLPPLFVDDVGLWLVLGDMHIPFHDKETCVIAANMAVQEKAVGVLLNGDIMDCAQVSRHAKTSTPGRLLEEVEICKEILTSLRQVLPKARIIYKAGNHEERLNAYVAERADALEGMEGVDLPSWLHLKELGIEWVDNSRIIRLGKLRVIHGHEYRGGGGGVNPARWLHLKSKSVSMCGHFHRTSSHTEPDMEGFNFSSWSVGCACDLKPEWLPMSGWNHGFATVKLKESGDFVVRNYKVLQGEAQ